MFSQHTPRYLLLLVSSFCWLIVVGCTSRAVEIVEKEIAVTVVVEKFVEVREDVEVEVTRLVELPIEVEKEVEVTRLVELAEMGRVEIELWTTDIRANEIAVYEQISAEFTQQNPNISIRIVPVAADSITQQLETARAANRLPDIVRMPVALVSDLSDEHLLNQSFASSLIDELGRDDFSPGALQLVATDDFGYAAVPSDGVVQVLWYRSDLFEQFNLDAPTDWDSILEAADRLSKHADIASAIVLPTDRESSYTRRIFEQIALSNGAFPFNEDGDVTMDSDEMVASFFWFYNMQPYALSQSRNLIAAREAYQNGDTAMFFSNSFSLDNLTETLIQQNNIEVEAPIEDLARRTAAITSISGPTALAASGGDLSVFAFTHQADEAATEVLQFFLDDQYDRLNAIDPFGRVPVRKSALEAWKSSSRAFADYDETTLNAIGAGFDKASLWLAQPGYDEVQRAVIRDMYREQLIPQVIDAVVVERTMTPHQGAAFLQEQIDALYSARLERQ